MENKPEGFNPRIVALSQRKLSIDMYCRSIEDFGLEKTGEFAKVKKTHSQCVLQGQEASKTKYAEKTKHLVEEWMLSMEGLDCHKASVQEDSDIPINDSDSDISNSNDCE